MNIVFFTRLLLVSSMVLCLAACQGSRSSVPAVSEEDAVGVAHLNKNGVLEVMLRPQKDDANTTSTRRGATGPNGETYFRCYKRDPDYQMYMQHVGGLKKDESKLIPPFFSPGAL